MPGPGEYSEAEQKFINWLAIFTIVLVTAGSIGLLWKCFHADFTDKVEYRESHASQNDAEK